MVILCEDDLGHVMRRHNVNFHSCAHGTQLYLSFNHSVFNQINTLNNCILDLKCWMAQNFLQLNIDKTEAIIIVLAESVSVPQNIWALCHKM